MREKACKFVLHGCVQSKISSNVIIKKKIAPNPLLLKMLLENRLNLRDLLAFNVVTITTIFEHISRAYF